MGNLFQPAYVLLHNLEFLHVYETGGQAELKHDTPNARIGELKSVGSGRASHSSENGWFLLWKAESLIFLCLHLGWFLLKFHCHAYLGFSKHFGRRGPTHGVKDVDGYSISSEGKHPRRTSGSAYGSHEVPKIDFCMCIHHIYFLVQ